MFRCKSKFMNINEVLWILPSRQRRQTTVSGMWSHRTAILWMDQLGSLAKEALNTRVSWIQATKFLYYSPKTLERTELELIVEKLWHTSSLPLRILLWMRLLSENTWRCFQFFFENNHLFIVCMYTLCLMYVCVLVTTRMPLFLW